MTEFLKRHGVLLHLDHESIRHAKHVALKHRATGAPKGRATLACILLLSMSSPAQAAIVMTQPLSEPTALKDELISTFLEKAHGAVNRVIAQLEGQVMARLNPAARQSLHRLARLLEQHMFLEEQIFFDVLVGVSTAAVARGLRQEHQRIHELLRQIAGLLESGRVDQALPLLQDLRELIAAHDERELRELAAVVARLDAAQLGRIHAQLAALAQR